MGKSKDKKSLREPKADKNSVLGVKRKLLKRRKKSGDSDGDVESEDVLEHDKEGRSKKTVLAMPKKKKNQLKGGIRYVKADDVLELLSKNMDYRRSKLKKNKKEKQPKQGRGSVQVYDVEEIVLDNNDVGTPKLKKKNKKLKERKSSAEHIDAKAITCGNQAEEILFADVDHLEAQSEHADIGEPEEVKSGKESKTKKVKKAGKSDKKLMHVEVDTTNVDEIPSVDEDMHASSKENKLVRHTKIDTANVDEILLVDEDCSRGMKKWILEYKRKRPGLKVLQQRIDEFITSHEEQQEQERKEREARAAEEGWTVVAHHKGRKKTTDAESGTTVGSVSLAALQETMAKKKPKEVDLNFYRFQKREAQRNEIMMLQSKFEQDKKRIQELRAQRKFKPY